MPRFYFDITENGLTATDADGLLIDTLDDAEHEAAWALAEIAAYHSRSHGREDLQATIRDEAHKPVACVFLTLSRQRL